MTTHRLPAFSSFLQLLSPVQAQVKPDFAKLPPGFRMAGYAEGVENTRQMPLGGQSKVFACSRRAGKLWVVPDPHRASLVLGDHAAVTCRISCKS